MSNIARYYNQGMSRFRSEAGKETIKDTLEAITIGGVAGIVSARRKGGLDEGDVPVDLVGGILGEAATMFVPMERDTRDLIRGGAGKLLAIGVFRKAEEWGKKGPAAAHGVDDDPIVRAAKML